MRLKPLNNENDNTKIFVTQQEWKKQIKACNQWYFRNSTDVTTSVWSQGFTIL